MSIWDEQPKLIIKMQNLWNSTGMSTSEIAKELGHNLTRSSICAKINRMRKDGMLFQDRMENWGGARSHKKKAQAFVLPGGAGGAVSRTKQTSSPVKSVAIPIDEPLPIGTIENFPDRDRKTCRHIKGDVAKPGWQLCGHGGYPWCPYHAKRFTVPSHPAGGGTKAYDSNQGSARVFR